MVELGLLAFLLVFAGVGVALTWGRPVGPATFWSWSLVDLLGAGLATVIAAHVSWSLAAGYAMGTTYPVLQLAGALSYAGRRVPVWIFPLSLAIGATRGLAVGLGAPWISPAIALAVEPAAALAAAVLVLRATPRETSTLQERLLPVGLGALVALEVGSLVAAAPGAALPPGLLVAWGILGPLLLVLQVAALAARTQRFLERGNEELERRVRERTNELALSVADLREQVEERRLAQEALRRSEERHRLVSELSSDYSFATRVLKDGQVRGEWSTSAFQRITGYGPGEMEGFGWLKLVDPKDLGLAQGAMNDVLEDRRQRFVFPFRTKQGEVRWLSVRLALRQDDSDGSVRIVGAAEDVTDQREAERERRRLDLRVQEMQRLESLGVLAGGIAHDFNNMLTVILGNTRLAMADLEDGESPAERLAHIESAAAHAAELTDLMLTSAGRASPQLGRVDVSDLVGGLVDLLRASLGPKIDVDVQLDATPPVDADSTQLRQLILNLARNAAEAMGGDGTVGLLVGRTHCTAERLAAGLGYTEATEGEYVTIEVTDRGPGLGDGGVARLFEPFFSTRSDGRGLGLAAVLGIVRGHRGVVEVSNRDEGGARFRVLLPVAEPAADARAAAADSLPARNHTVLLVDDDPGVLEVASEFLRRAGLTVVAAEGGRAALDLLTERGDELDVAVLDLVMPDVDGEEVYHAIRGARPDLPVVVASGFDRQRAAARFPAGDVHGFLKKPYDFDELVRRVSRLVAERPRE